MPPQPGQTRLQAISKIPRFAAWTNAELVVRAEAACLRAGGRVHAAQLAVLALADEALDRRRCLRSHAGRLEARKPRVALGHRSLRRGRPPLGRGRATLPQASSPSGSETGTGAWRSIAVRPRA